MLILAGVTLTTALGQNGLFQRAKYAVEKYKESEADEAEKLGEIEKEIDKMVDGKDPQVPPVEGNTTTPPQTEAGKGPNGKPLPQTVTDITDETVYGEDSLGNPVVIPGGFKFAGKEGDTVQDGIIIADDEGNEFVWIPVSNTNEDGTGKIKTKDKGDVEITLGRYTFDTSSPGTPELKQSGSNHSVRSDSTKIESDIYEDTSENNRPNGGFGAKDLAAFVQSVQDNHGYYLARYEASYKSGSSIDDYKPYLKPSTSNSKDKTSYTSGMLWNFITQEDASKASQNMYSVGDVEATYVESDLVNSYAWDTAIVYIQAMGNENYANASSTTNGNYNQLKNTGETGDVKCNIYDMAANLFEWTTEYSANTYSGNPFPCVVRGGSCGTYYYTAYRSDDPTAHGYLNVGFRPLLYLKEL